MMNFAPLLIGMIFVVGCTTTNVKKQTDSMTGEEVFSTDYLHIYSGPGVAGGVKTHRVDPSLRLAIKFHKRQQTDGSQRKYGVELYYWSENPLYTRPYNFGGKESLWFKIDGKLVKLSTQSRSSATYGRSPGIISRRKHEFVKYASVDEALLRAIAKSKNVQMRAQSDRETFNGYLRGQTLVALNKMLRD